MRVSQCRALRSTIGCGARSTARKKECGVEKGSPRRHGAAWGSLRRLDVLGARALRSLPGLKCHRVAFAKRIERRTGRLVEEIFLPVGARNESESFFTNHTLDRALHFCPCDLLVNLTVETYPNRSWSADRIRDQVESHTDAGLELVVFRALEVALVKEDLRLRRCCHHSRRLASQSRGLS